MENIKINNNSNSFWLINMDLDIAKGCLIATLGESPDSEKVSHILFFEELEDVEIDYFDEMDSDYRSTFLGLIGDASGSYILTTDEFEVSLKAQKFYIEEK